MTQELNQAQAAVENPILFHMQRYHDKKPAGDIDMIEEVRKLLIEAGQGNKIHIYDNHPRIVDAKNRHSDVQRHALNQFWMVQLGACEKPSFNERTYLLPRGDKSEWLKVFNLGVMPFIIENDLPNEIHEQA